jgi:O-antigen/teichoic acid export membrane protein
MSQPRIAGRPVPPRGSNSPATGPGSADLAAVGRGSRLGLIGAAFSAIANLVLALIVTRGFGRHDAGLFFSATAAFLVLEMLARLGTDTAAVYFIARLRALGDSHLIVAHLRAALKPVAVVVVTCSALLAIFAGLLSRDLLGGSSPVDLQVMAACLPFAVIYDICLAATRGFGTVKTATLLEKMIRPGLQLTLLAIVAAIGKPDLLAIAWALPFILVLPFAVLKLLAQIRGENVKQLHRPERSVSGDFWRFAAPRSVTGLAQALLQRLDIIIVAAILGPADAAVYAAATRFLVLGQLGNQAISAPVEPRLSGLLARRDIAGARDVYRLSTAWLICVNWPLFLMTAVYAPTIMEAFGKGYHSGWTVAMLLCLCMLIAVGVGLVDVVLIMGGRTSWNLYNTVAALAINISVDVVLLPHIGIIGAAVGWGVAILATNLVPLVQIHHLLGLHPFGKRVFTAAAAAVTSFGLIPGIIRFALGTGLTSLVVAGMAGLIVYLILLSRFRDVLQLDLLLGRFLKRLPQIGGTPAPKPAPPAPPAPAVTAVTADSPAAASPVAAAEPKRARIGRHRWSD